MKRTTKRTVAIGVILAALCLASFFLLRAAFHPAIFNTDDPADYPAVLQSLRRPGSSALGFFPNEIPEAAQNVYLHYQLPLGQGGLIFSLKYEMDTEEIQAYQTMAAHRAIWSGSPTDKDAQSMGVYAGSLVMFDYAENGIPPDFTVYLIHQKQPPPKDWNHGEIGLMGISMDACEVVFSFESW